MNLHRTPRREVQVRPRLTVSSDGSLVADPSLVPVRSGARRSRSRRGRAAAVITAVAVLAGLLSAGSGPAHAVFPGANGKIVYSKLIDANWYLFSVYPDGTGETQLTSRVNEDLELTSTYAHRDWRPSFSPDGTKIVFDRFIRYSTNTIVESHDYELYMMDADGSNVTRITWNPAGARGIEEADAKFLPDGKRIVFSAKGSPLGHTGVWEVYTMDPFADGRDPSKWTRLTWSAAGSNPTASERPAVSPDGKIAFNRAVDNNYEIFTINPDGTGEKRLTHTPTVGEQYPSFSPDGQKIAYAAGGGISTINAEDGSNPTPLTNNKGGGWDWLPTYSPDGKQMAFLQFNNLPNNSFNLFVMNVADDGTGNTNLTNYPLGINWPDWGIVPGSAPPPTVSVGNARVNEGDTGQALATFTVSLSRPVDHPAAISYATADGTATAAGNQADYVASSGTLTFAPGEKTKTVTVSVKGDRRPEPDETFYLYLSSPSGATLEETRGTGTIVNDDGKK